MEKILGILKALSDRNRLRIVSALSCHDELCACQIVELLDVTGATASRHLAILVACGILESRRAGRWNYFRLVNSAFGSSLVSEVLKLIEKSNDAERDREILSAILQRGQSGTCKTVPRC